MSNSDFLVRCSGTTVGNLALAPFTLQNGQLLRLEYSFSAQEELMLGEILSGAKQSIGIDVIGNGFYMKGSEGPLSNETVGKMLQRQFDYTTDEIDGLCDKISINQDLGVFCYPGSVQRTIFLEASLRKKNVTVFGIRGMDHLTKTRLLNIAVREIAARRNIGAISIEYVEIKNQNYVKINLVDSMQYDSEMRGH